MRDRIDIEEDADGDISIILRPKPREKGDIEARAIRDAIDYLAELLISQGQYRKGEILLGITEQEDIVDPVVHTPIMRGMDPEPQFAFGVQGTPQPTEYIRQVRPEPIAIEPIGYRRAEEALTTLAAPRPRRR